MRRRRRIRTVVSLLLAGAVVTLMMRGSAHPQVWIFYGPNGRPVVFAVDGRKVYFFATTARLSAYTQAPWSTCWLKPTPVQWTARVRAAEADMDWWHSLASFGLGKGSDPLGWSPTTYFIATIPLWVLLALALVPPGIWIVRTHGKRIVAS